jgi:hypothetical protein
MSIYKMPNGKDPREAGLDFTIDMGSEVGNAQITSCTWSVTPTGELSIVGQDIVGAKLIVYLSGGVVGTQYTVTAEADVDVDPPRTLVRSFLVQVVYK